MGGSFNGGAGTVLLSRATVARPAFQPARFSTDRLLAGYLDTDHAGQRNPQLHPDGKPDRHLVHGITVEGATVQLTINTGKGLLQRNHKHFQRRYQHRSTGTGHARFAGNWVNCLAETLAPQAKSLEASSNPPHESLALCAGFCFARFLFCPLGYKPDSQCKPGEVGCII